MSKTTASNDLPNFHLLIPAAGTASRMALETPKPYLKINGRSVLTHTINKFINISSLKSIVVIINEEHSALFDNATKNIDNCQYVFGSNARKNSVYNGLKSFSNVKNDDVILIHDAARPMVQRTDVEALLRVMKTADAATLATPVVDTLIKDSKPLDRENVWGIQTPQAFKYGALIAAHEKFKDDDSFTDDTGLIRAMGHKVETVASSRENIKITTQDDLAMVQKMMMSEMETRTASGYDVHAFEAAPSDRKLMMGGIEIPHDLALTGHSDADVVLHAITDALLGSVNEGDIGTHFPPSDPQWKDANSALFLKEAVSMINARSGDIQFIDITIMAETPKIGQYRKAMQERIAEIIGIPPSRISIKATTTEKLGFTGRKEGIACQALTTVQLPAARES